MEPTAVPGTPWEGEISLGNFSGGPPEDNNEFCFGPGGLRERFGSLPGSLLEPSWRPRGPRRPPRAILAPFWERKWSPEASFLKLFWTRWGSILVTFALCCLRPRVYVDLLALASRLFWERRVPPKMGPAKRPSCQQLSFVFAGVLVVVFCFCRLRSPHFESSKPSRPQAPSGRRGSRSD